MKKSSYENLTITSKINELEILICPLGELFSTTSGGTPSRSRAAYYGGAIPWVKSGELDKGIIYQTEEYITKEAIINSNAKVFSKGTLLIALYGATIGKMAFLGIDAATNQAICAIFDNKHISLKYVYYFLLHKRNKLISVGAGGAQPNISQAIIRSQLLPIFPKQQQKRIVEKIEALFSELDNGINALKTAQAQLKTYRQSVLKHAFEGKLIHCEEEFILQKLSSVIKTIDGDRGVNYPKKNEFKKDGYCLFLSTKNVREGEFVFVDNIFISKEKDESMRGGKLQIGDVVVTTRGTLGNVAIYDIHTPFKNIRINSGMLILRISDAKLNNRYLKHFITSPLFTKQLKTLQSGTAQPQIPANVLREICIPIFSSLELQQKIVAEIEKRLSECDQMEENINASLAQATALRQSILKRAFCGKLVPQDPTDEPASVLLERIRTERKKG